MKITFWQGVMILIGIIIAIVIYGMVAPGGVPGVPNPKAKIVHVSVRIHRGFPCRPSGAFIEGAVVEEKLCTPTIGDPQGNGIVRVIKEGWVIWEVKKKVDCSCPWGIGWCEAHDTIDVCLEPGIYDLEFYWEGITSDRLRVVVPG